MGTNLLADALTVVCGTDGAVLPPTMGAMVIQLPSDTPRTGKLSVAGGYGDVPARDQIVVRAGLTDGPVTPHVSGCVHGDRRRRRRDTVSMMGLLDVASADGDVRYVPADEDALSFEALAHESRYLWALPHVEGRRVLDFGCGSGFGSARMASVAAEVDGIDYSPSAVAFANNQFGRPGVTFVAGDVTDPDVTGLLRPLYDTLVSFDVIEHVDRYPS